MKRMLIIAGVAGAVLAAGALALHWWPKAPFRPHSSQPPAAPTASAPGVPGPLDAFDLRDVGTGRTRIKLWVTPPGARAAYGVEFTGKGDALTALVQRRGSADHTPVGVPAGWADRLNAAVRRPSARGVAADLVVERAGEVPEKYEVRFDLEGAGWAVLDEILSHYGLISYTVAKGDTPSSIAKKLLGDSRRWSDILAINPGLKPEKMQPGDVIHVPRK